MSIFKKTIDEVVGKTQSYTAATSLSMQQKAKENGIMQEINQYKLQRDNISGKIGQKSYELYLNGIIMPDEIMDLCNLVHEAVENLNNQEQILKTIQDEYNIQLEMIKKGSIHGSQKGNCPNCGTEYIIESELFCKECGADLRKTTLTQQQKTSSYKCLSCQNPYSEDDIFCKYCGNKIKQQTE